MDGPQESRAKAEHYAILADAAQSSEERERFLRMKRSHELMARIAEFGAALDGTIQQLKR